MGAFAAIAALCLLGADTAEPADVQILVIEDDIARAQAADRLLEDLTKQAGVTARDVLLAVAATRPVIDWARLEKRVKRAEAEYTNLNPEAAIALVTELSAELLPRLDNEEAVALMARVLRVRGQTEMYQEKRAPAAVSFAAAAVLDEDFSPMREEWPPETRLAYADAAGMAKRAAPGSLSIKVEPSFARVWLDGEEVGLGSTTVQRVKRGEHFLLARAPGHRLFAAVITVRGGGRLDEATVFLEKENGNELPTLAAGEMARAFGTEKEARVARQTLRALDKNGLVIVVADPVVPSQQAAWVVDEAGARSGSFISLDQPNAAEVVGSRILGKETVIPNGEDQQWHTTWWFWTAVGGVAVVGGIAAIILAATSTNDNVTLVIGRP